MLDTFRKTFYLVGRDKPWRWVALIIAAVVASGFEMLGAVLIYLLVALVIDPTGGLDIPLVGDIRGLFGEVEQTTFLIGAAAVLGVFFLLRLALQVTYTYVKHRLAHSAGERLSTRLATGYLRLPYSFHLRRNSSELIRNAHQNVEELSRQCFLSVIYVISELLLVLGLVAVMVLIAPAATAMAVVIIGSAALVLLMVVQPRLKGYGQEAQASRKQTLAALQQSLYGIRDIKVLGTEQHFGRTYGKGRRDLARSLYKHGTVVELPRLVIETSLVGFILLLFAVSVATGTATDELLSTLGLFAYAGLRIQPSLQKLVSGLNNVKYSAAAVEDVYSDLAVIEQLDDDDGDAEVVSFEDELRLESVSFAYEDTNRPALRDAELVVRPGELIGICGPTGGGKTTLTDLIIGLLEPTEGRVTVDGRDIAEHRSGWFRKLGVVPQMVFVTDDSLRRNIALGVDDEEIDEEALAEAVQLAQLDGFVRELPDELDTVVGERGVRVSGGQRQRVAIARALYRHPEVLVFDEGTSALDTATESVLIDSLERLRGERTIILVAHRLSTVRHCDRILYIEDGRIAASGDYEQLRSESAGFRALASGT